MFATELHVESRQAISDPNWDQIESALLQLDGSTVTFVGVKGNGPDVSITVGGGSYGKYVVSATYDNRRFFTVVNPEAGEDKVSMVTAGQPGEFEARKCVGLAAILRAVRTFATTGERDKALKWSMG